MVLCGKGHDNWSTWTSTNETIHKYCKTCRQERARNYLERKKISGGKHTKKEFAEQLKQYKKCPGCNRVWDDIPFSKGSAKYKITEDHIVPLLKGGTDSIENIQPLCYQCNFSKGHSLSYYLIPRRNGDVVEPKGGIRNVIPGKGKY